MRKWSYFFKCIQKNFPNSVDILRSQYVKSVQVRSLFWSVFSLIRTEYREILRISPYSVRMRENTDQKTSVSGHFSLSDP